MDLLQSFTESVNKKIVSACEVHLDGDVYFIQIYGDNTALLIAYYASEATVTSECHVVKEVHGYSLPPIVKALVESDIKTGGGSNL